MSLRQLTIVPLVLAGVLAGLAAPASAHHSGSMYDDKRTVTLDGTVARYLWANPHVYIYVQEPVPGGSTREWEIEGSPPSILRQLGWSATTLHTGDKVHVTGHPSKEAQRLALLPVTIQQGGTVLFDRSKEMGQLAGAATAPGSARAPADLQGVWVTRLSEKVEDALAPESQPLTKRGKEAVKRYDEKKNPGANCIANPAPLFMITPDLKRISTGAGVVYLDGSFDAARRTVHMDVSSHAGAEPSVQGHSIGRWEGTTLVIDTDHFAEHALGDGDELPSSAGKHLVERLTPDAAGKTLTYHFELSDPVYLSKPVIAEAVWVYQPGGTYTAEPCNPQTARHYLGR